MKWHVRVIGKIPEQLEIEADTFDDAENEALNEVFAGLDIKVEPITEPPPARLFLVPKGENKCAEGES